MSRIIILFLFAATCWSSAFAQIDLTSLYNYANQPIPNYITRDNTGSNVITDEAATLGRVLFYDKNLSVNNTIACASCHIQEFAFSDTAIASVGVNGTTGRHSMRLVNPRFATLQAFFWDRRASTLEEQTTMPIQDHAEMGFSGTQGDPDLDSLISKLQGIDYYQRLFTFAFGDSVITEVRMQNALAQFIRSIQSFDSKYDTGIANAPNANAPFNNFTGSENSGKQLFTAPPQFNGNGMRTGGGLGCAGCHAGPEFDIDPASLHNGVTGFIGGGTDNTNTRSPSLRDLFNTNGQLNTALMHNGAFASINAVLNHYNDISPSAGIDPRLTPAGQPQQLQLTAQERTDVIAFLMTLSGSDMYTNAKWSDPFNTDGSLTVLPLETTTGIDALSTFIVKIYPTFVDQELTIETSADQSLDITIYNISGQQVYSGEVLRRLDVGHLYPGQYFLEAKGQVTRFVKL